jgi:hypothetical protein
MANTRDSQEPRLAAPARPERRVGALGSELSQSLRGVLRFWLTATDAGDSPHPGVLHSQLLDENQLHDRC